MKSFVYQIVTKKAQTLRMCTLFVLCALIAGLYAERPQARMTDARQPSLSGLTVAVDAGHGGYDGGARAHDSGKWEKEITLQIALKLEQELSARGAQAVLTRRADESLDAGDKSGRARKRADLQKRLDIADQAGADVFLSIHLNEYRSRAESGPQVFYQHGADAGRLLAGTLQQALIEGLDPPKKRSAMAGDYYVLRGKLPAALVECGFLSNAREEKLLMDEDYQQRIAASIADGLENYVRLSKRSGADDL